MYQFLSYPNPFFTVLKTSLRYLKEETTEFVFYFKNEIRYKKKILSSHSLFPAQSNFPKKESTKQQQDETDYGAHFSSNTTNTSTFSFGMKLTPTASSSNSPLGPNSSSKEGALQNNKEDAKPPQFSTDFSSLGSSKEENKPQFSAGFFSQNTKQEDKGPSQFSAGFFSKALQSSADKPFSFATAPVASAGWFSFWVSCGY